MNLRSTLQAALRRVFGSALFALVVCSAAQAQPRLASENQALNLLVASIEATRLYGARLDAECLRYFAEDATPDHFDFAVRENHDGDGCPGDPETQPLVDRFRVGRTAQTIARYDPVSGDYVAFAVARTEPEPGLDPESQSRLPGLPKDAAQAADRLAACIHFSGEFNGDGSERDREVTATLDELRCRTVDDDVAAIREKYAADQAVLSALDAITQE